MPMAAATASTAEEPGQSPPPKSTESLERQTEIPTESPPSQEEEEAAESFPSLGEVEEIIGYKFNNRSLLEEALTHTSYPLNDLSYERLEYVGDSVLNLMITKMQYFAYPDLPPGSLTRLRAANVNTEKLARVAIRHGLYKYLRHKKPQINEQIEKFIQEISNHPLHSDGLIRVPKALADIVESTIGAVYIDSDSSLDTVWKVFKGLLEPIINPETLRVHPVTELFELCQKKGWNIRFVDSWKESTCCDVLIEGQLVGRAAYALNKGIALKRAAKDALNHVYEMLAHKENANS